jgi:hypothetical protein
MVEVSHRSPPRHGTDQDLKPLPSFPGFCLPARSLHCRQEEHRSRCATAQGFDRSLLALPFAGAGYDQPFAGVRERELIATPSAGKPRETDRLRTIRTDIRSQTEPSSQSCGFRALMDDIC